MTFYQKRLGGELNFQTVGESPMSDRMPARMKKCILTATLQNHRLVLTGTDLITEHGLIKGNNIALLLQCKDLPEIKRLYKELSARGMQIQPPQKNFWGMFVGTLRDKFGVNWVLQMSETRQLSRL